MGSYVVNLSMDEHTPRFFIECEENQTILAASELVGIGLPYSCRRGVCSKCTGRITDGEIDQSEQTFLDDDQMADDSVLTRIAYPKSDCNILIHQEHELY